ncbi:MAG: hypothetical protein AAF705_18410, partial [Bacteroidota bacterium]
TSNSWYARDLIQMGFPTRVTPIFSNLPVIDPKRSTHEDGDKLFRGVFFGSFQPEWDFEPVAQVLQKTNALGYDVELISVGGKGPGREKWKEFVAKYDSEFRFIDLGRQDAEVISHTIASANVGLTTNAEAFLTKSGTVATFIEHGIPVLFSRADHRDPETDAYKFFGDQILSIEAWDRAGGLPSALPQLVSPHSLSIHTLNQWKDAMPTLFSPQKGMLTNSTHL